jgi:hypothetical protein
MPLATSWPVIEKDCLTGAEGGAEIVRVGGVLAGVMVAVGVLASITGVALHNDNAQITSTAATITTLFSPNIPTHLDVNPILRRQDCPEHAGKL